MLVRENFFELWFVYCQETLLYMKVFRAVVIQVREELGIDHLSIGDNSCKFGLTASMALKCDREQIALCQS